MHKVTIIAFDYDILINAKHIDSASDEILECANTSEY